MRKFIGNVLYLVGCILIGLARTITLLRSMLLIIITMFIVMGVLAITLIGFFDLVTPDLNTLGKVYWDIIAVVLGGATMWLGFKKIFEEDKQAVENKQFMG
jgi:hypothetical protein